MITNPLYPVVCILPVAVCALRTLRLVHVLLFLHVFRGIVLVVAVSVVTGFLEVDWVFPLIEITITNVSSDKLVRLASGLDARCVKKQCGLVGLCYGGRMALDLRLSRARTGVVAIK